MNLSLALNASANDMFRYDCGEGFY